MTTESEIGSKLVELQPDSFFVEDSQRSDGCSVIAVPADTLISGLLETLFIVIYDNPLPDNVVSTQTLDDLLHELRMGTLDLVLLVLARHDHHSLRIRNKWALASYKKFGRIVMSGEVDSLRDFVSAAFPPECLNPYQSERVVTKSMFYGRQDEVKDICESKYSYAVFGGRRVGKSSFARRVERQLAGTASYLHTTTGRSFDVHWTSVCYLDVHTIATPEGIWRAILDKMGFDVKDLMLGSRFRKSIEERKGLKTKTDYEILQQILHAQSDRALFLLDEVDQLLGEDRASGYAIFSLLQGLVDDQECNLRVVLFGYEGLQKAFDSDSFPLNHTRLKLKPLGPIGADDVGSLIRNPMRDLGVAVSGFDEIRDQIYQATGGMPNLVQDLCAVILKMPAVNDNRTVTIREVSAGLKDKYFIDRIDYQFQQVQDPLARLVAYFGSQQMEISLNSILDVLADEDVDVHDGEVREAFSQLQMFNIVQPVAALDEYVFSSNVMRNRVRAQLEKDEKKSRIRLLVRSIRQRSLTKR